MVVGCKTMAKRSALNGALFAVRFYSRIAPPPPAYAQPVIRVSNNIAYLGSPKEGPKPRQLLSLPPFPGLPLPGKTLLGDPGRLTAISWVKYYFNEMCGKNIESHFKKGLIKPHVAMEVGAKIHVPVSIAESRISKRFDTIPCGTLYPNKDEIDYLQRLVKYKDAALIVLNKPPKLPVKGSMPVHNSMDALAAAALSYDYDEGPKLVHRLDRESSGLILLGRTKESVSYLQWIFSNLSTAKSRSKLHTKDTGL